MLHLTIHRVLRSAKTSPFRSWVPLSPPTPLRNLKDPSFQATAAEIPPTSSREISFSGTQNGRAFSTDQSSRRTTTTWSHIHSIRSISQAESALLDYLHCTRGFDFTDAEHISRNSPIFLSNLLNRVVTADHNPDVGMAITRFLRYHPINEFEPFFESIGVRPHRLRALLPKTRTFLRDDVSLMENYKVLCNYGFPRKRIGKMCTKAIEMFGYAPGVLACKLRAYEDVVGLAKPDVVNVISACPRMLVGDPDREFMRVLKQLESIGIDPGWIGKNVCAKDDYGWGRMARFLCFFLGDLGFDRREMGMLIRRRPEFLLDGSGKAVFCVVALFLKLGATRMEIYKLLSSFPPVRVGRYLKNMQTALCFLIDIDMEPGDIKIVVRSRPQQLGSCDLLKPGSVKALLAVGKKRLCEIIKRDPENFLHYVKGAKLEPVLPASEDDLMLTDKKKSFLSLGFVEDDRDVGKALSFFRGKAHELQQRHSYLTSKGFGQDDISRMMRAEPRVLGQSFKSLKRKVDFLIDRLGYPVEILAAHPRCLQYSMERIEHRVRMYDWLQSEGKVDRTLSLTTILQSSDKLFMRTLVNRHPKGPETWDKFRKAVYTC